MPKQAGLQVFSTAGSTLFQVPVGIYVLYVATIVGGGGGGIGGPNGGNVSVAVGGGGGAGQVIQNVRIPPSGQFSGDGTEYLYITVGQGGAIGTGTSAGLVPYTSASRGGNGTASSVALYGGATYVTAAFGYGGYYKSYSAGNVYNNAWQGEPGDIFTRINDIVGTADFNYGTRTYANSNGGGHILGKGSIIVPTSPPTVVASTIAGTGGSGGYTGTASTTYNSSAGQAGLVVLQW